MNTQHPKTWYDKNRYEELFYKKKRGGKHDIGMQFEGIIPDEAAIRLLGNRHRQCEYYQAGVEVCHAHMLQQGATNFLACKKPVDQMWQCYTEEKYGQSFQDAPEYAQKYVRNFFDCWAREASGLDVCMHHFSNAIRAIHRSGESELNSDF